MDVIPFGIQEDKILAAQRRGTLMSFPTCDIC